MRMSKRSPAAILAAAALIVATVGGKVYGITPFGAAMFCALSCEFFIGLIVPIYLLCEFLFSFELWRLYAAGAIIFIMAVRWVLGLKLSALDRGAVKAMFSLFAIIAHTVLSGLFMPVADAVAAGFIGCLFYYFAANVSACARSTFAYKPGIVECASVCVTFFVMGLAFGRARLGVFTVGLAPAMLALLFLGLIGTNAVFGCGMAIALGLGTVDIALVPAIAASVFAIAAFGRLPRLVYAPTAVATFSAVGVLFHADPIFIGWSALMLTAGALPFCILPPRAVKCVRDYFDYGSSARLALRHYVNRCKSDAGNRMLAVASVFDETARLMNVMTSPPPDYAAMGRALSDKLCPYCAKRGECDSARASQAFAKLAECSAKNRAILSDLPEFFTSACCRVSDVIAASAAITDGARTTAREREGEDKARSIVVERLAAIKDVLEELGRSEALPVGFDADSEKRIADELNTSGVECAEVFVTREGVTAVVRTASAATSRERIRKAVSVCMKHECELVSLDKTQAAGWSVASLKRRPTYDAAYARAGLAKSGVTGDSYMFERVGNKFLAALLDGMGHGSGASASSGAAVELISCFYRAGFDSQSVMSGVNRFLKLPTAENYSAADVAVCNLENAAVDIIKLGAPPCYIKTADTVLRIEGGALPIGVLDEIRPFVTTKRLYPGQMLIMVSDGVSDCFSGDELPELINGLSALNPERMVGAIVSRAQALSGGEPKDDMTAIAFRLFEKKR